MSEFSRKSKKIATNLIPFYKWNAYVLEKKQNNM